ncbi:lipopolysaccharide kinase InaA family protein [Rubritalea sp.]|uniref:lipopolysaccharide kinase InaA family protein n=1 Tax=Rubritalea sp. TaxID=2109375 RepID=UPI003EF24883
MTNKSFTDPQWVSIFEQAGYPDFDSWWQAEGELVEEGNFRGKDKTVSWSNVHRITLNSGEIVYLKRQQNHFPTNTLLRLLKIPTFAIEWRNYQKLQSAGIPTMRILQFANRKHEGDRQCLIVSKNLTGMSELNNLVEWYDQHGWPPRAQRRAILRSILDLVKKAHQAGIIHNALYGRHIYLNIPFVDGTPVIPTEINSCFIDLERAKYPGKRSIKFISRDLKVLYWNSLKWSNSDIMWFFKQYLGITKLTPDAKQKAKLIIGSPKIK